MTRTLDLEAIATEEAGSGPFCVLYSAGQPLSLYPVKGAALEGSLVVSGGFLVFMTELNPYEDALHLHFFDEDWQHKDHIEISAPYSAGILSELRQIAPNKAIFRFPKSLHWLVEVHERPIPWFKGPWNLSFRELRSLLGKRHLAVYSYDLS